jgi:hypothetical protein
VLTLAPLLLTGSKGAIFVYFVLTAWENTHLGGSEIFLFEVLGELTAEANLTTQTKEKSRELIHSK